MSILELRRLMLLLETAIERVEAHSAQRDQLCAQLELQTKLIESPRRSEYRAANGHPNAAVIMDQTHGVTPSKTDDCITVIPSQRRNRLGVRALLRATILTAMAIAIGVIVGQNVTPSKPNTSSGLSAITKRAVDTIITPEATLWTPAKSPDRSLGSPAVPLPNVYGIYALSGGQLFELEALPGRVPDQKVFMSTPVKTQSRAVLPDGRVTFIVFRRDVAMSTPDRMSVRVIAKVKRAMTFATAGTPSTAVLDDQWTIRGTSFEFRVAPRSESMEMLSVGPVNSEFVFPSGRYGLVVKGQAYDFSVAGPITDRAQCLERTEAANGNFYSECQSP